MELSRLNSPAIRYALAFLALLMVALAIIVRWRSVIHDPHVPLLIPQHGAEWILRDEPFELAAQPGDDLQVFFRAEFDVDSVPSQAMLTVHSFRLCRVHLN